jgi:uncharacterized damage-inducible protein DinB
MENQITSIEPFVHEATSLLLQGCAVIRQLSDTDYTNTTEEGCSISMHWRHILNHYQSFIRGYRTRHIDYTARLRDSIIEYNSEVSLKTAAAITTQLMRHSYEDGIVTVKGDVGITASTAARELEFIINHTTHHYALMRPHLLRYDVPKEFGFAKSTVEAQCVR